MSGWGHLFELCRYVVLNPVCAKMVSHSRIWAWGSYRAMVGETKAPVWLATDWIIGQFGQRVSEAHSPGL